MTTLESSENFTAQNSIHKKPQFLQTPAVFVTCINASSAAQGFWRWNLSAEVLNVALHHWPKSQQRKEDHKDRVWGQKGFILPTVPINILAMWDSRDCSIGQHSFEPLQGTKI